MLISFYKRKLKVFIVFLIFFVFSSCKKEGKRSQEEDEFPVHIQRSAKDCGPVCLKMILDFYKKDIILDSIKKNSSFNELEGTSLLGLSEALFSVGVDNMGVQMTYEFLLYKKLPSVIHWNNDHFIVLYKVKKDSAWCVDPSISKVCYSKKEFCKG